jgi:hypothetical protein
MKSFRKYAVGAAFAFATVAVAAAPAFAQGTNNPDSAYGQPAHAKSKAQASYNTAARRGYYDVAPQYAPGQDSGAGFDAGQWPTGFKDLH